MFDIKNCKQFTLSNGAIVSCHTQPKKSGVLHVCEIYGRYTALTFSNKKPIPEKYLYATVIEKNLTILYGKFHEIKVLQ